MKVTWLGHAFFLIETLGVKILIDPFISGNPKCPLAELPKANIILVTHGHGDHLGDAVEICKKSGAKIFAIYELAEWLAAQGCDAVGMNISGTVEEQGVKITQVFAAHSSGNLQQDGRSLYLGEPTGFVVEAEGKRVYHAGDTGLFSDMKLIGELYSPDLALLPIGGQFTMSPREAAKAVELLKPSIVVPMHYQTFPAISGKPEEFAASVKGVQVRVLAPGESIEL